MFMLCTTNESVEEAVPILSNAEYLILDCEGRDLGCANGALALLSIGTPHASHIYLFDVLALPHRSLQILFNAVLSHTAAARGKTKVVWDGRMDYVELFYSYSCPIENVLDLQLVDVLSRKGRGESDYVRMRRMGRRSFPLSEVKKLQVEEVYVLNSMDDNLSDVWMVRPLTDALLEYAASDITRIAALYDHFRARGYLEQTQRLRAQSMLYVTMHHTAGKPEQENIFLRGPYLPLCVLQPVSLDDGNKASWMCIRRAESDEQGILCMACKRTMLDVHFPLRSAAVLNGAYVGNKKGKARTQICKICTLILAKKQYATDHVLGEIKDPSRGR
ncbi:ribonuclease H-like domain-containing protein [Phellopilus nigrolimitatus]|nr:ribonuclease H-like domain-containing protein [Phellopilus nigrolimitatus]